MCVCISFGRCRHGLWKTRMNLWDDASVAELSGASSLHTHTGQQSATTPALLQVNPNSTHLNSPALRHRVGLVCGIPCSPNCCCAKTKIMVSTRRPPHKTRFPHGAPSRSCSTFTYPHPSRSALRRFSLVSRAVQNFQQLEHHGSAAKKAHGGSSDASVMLGSDPIVPPFNNTYSSDQLGTRIHHLHGRPSSKPAPTAAGKNTWVGTRGPAGGNKELTARTNSNSKSKERWDQGLAHDGSRTSG